MAHWHVRPHAGQGQSLQSGGSISELVLLLRAAQFAAEKHKAQHRKDVEGSPYINHPIAVAELLARVGGVHDPEVLAAALLHDTVEDTDATFDEIERAFGVEVRRLVAEVTDDKTLSKEVRKQLQIEHAAHASVGAKLIKLGDKICNVIDVLDNPPSGWARQRRAEYLEWAGKVVDQCRGTNAALEAEFDRVVGRGLSDFA